MRNNKIEATITHQQLSTLIFEIIKNTDVPDYYRFQHVVELLIETGLIEDKKADFIIKAFTEV